MLKQLKNSNFNANWLQILIIIVLAIGVFFRFVNLDKKVYWTDEVASSIRISGYNFEEVKDLGFRGEQIGVQDLQKYQYPNPEKGLGDILKGLAAEEPQLPPLYFISARFWVQLFGNSVAVTRSFSAVVSLLAFPCIYWLCQELFASALVGWVAMALIAVSPLHVLYAQESRFYSLWSVTILLSSAALLRAMRLQTKSSWIVYAASLALGFYTFLLTGLVAVGHGIYVIVSESFRLSKTIKAYLLASVAGVLFFLPWIITVLSNYSSADGATSWTKDKVHFPALVRTWILNLSRIFFDFNENFETKYLLLYILMIALVVYSVYYLYRQTQKQTWLFVFTLIGVSALTLALPDVMFGGRRSSVIRYLLPSFLGIQIAIAYLLATKITSLSLKIWQQKLWQIATLILISFGILSGTVSSQSDTWWNKYKQIHNPAVAKIINQTEKPLVIMPGYELLALSHVLDPRVRLQSPALRQVKTPTGEIGSIVELKPLGKNFSHVFVYNIENALQDVLKKQPNLKLEKTFHWKRQVEPVYTTQTRLWKLSKKG